MWLPQGYCGSCYNAMAGRISILVLEVEDVGYSFCFRRFSFNFEYGPLVALSIF